ncbi:MAG TPA: hypothetical protein DGG94_10250 [Micromonosporaceae bacterium]|nr:hypothetical protein [Micromonosporaceae bacterium]
MVRVAEDHELLEDLMLFSGVSWSATGYEVEVVDGNGQQAMRPVRFGAGHIDEMIIYLGGIGPRLITVVDSTCGILDGRMMAAGLGGGAAAPPPPRRWHRVARRRRSG